MYGLLLIAWLVAAPGDSPVATQAGAPAAVTSGQRKFPWYDDEKRAFRPLKAPVEDKSTGSWLDWLFGSGDRKGPAIDLSWASILLYIILAVVLGWLAYLFYLSLDLQSSEPELEPEIPTLDPSRLEALPAAVRNVTDFLAEAQKLAQAGDFNAAMVFFHSWQLVTLNQAEVLELEVGKTNRQYVREITHNRPELRELFMTSTRLFEDAFYGNFLLDGDAFTSVWERRDEFRKPSQARRQR